METDLLVIWLLLLTTITLNIIIFVNDPLKSSTSNTKKCLGIKCRDYSLYTFIILMTCDIFILIALLSCIIETYNLTREARRKLNF